MNKYLKLLCALLVLLSLLACDRGQIFHQLRPSSKILVFGDSLTADKGAEEGLRFPAQLQKMIARKVVNAGKNAELSEDGVRRLPAILDEVEPDIVILFHGGNDLLQGRDPQQLKTNIRRMFEAVNQRGIPMIMIAVPRPRLPLKDASLYVELAEELNIPLVEGVLSKILSNERLRSDPAHPNAAGYEQLSKAVADLLFEVRAI